MVVRSFLLVELVFNMIPRLQSHGSSHGKELVGVLCADGSYIRLPPGVGQPDSGLTLALADTRNNNLWVPYVLPKIDGLQPVMPPAPMPIGQPPLPETPGQPPAPKPIVQPLVPKPIGQPLVRKMRGQPPVPVPVPMPTGQPPAPKPIVQPLVPKPIVQPLVRKKGGQPPVPMPTGQPPVSKTRWQPPVPNPTCQQPVPKPIDQPPVRKMGGQPPVRKMGGQPPVRKTRKLSLGSVEETACAPPPKKKPENIVKEHEIAKKEIWSGVLGTPIRKMLEKKGWEKFIHLVEIFYCSDEAKKCRWEGCKVLGTTQRGPEPVMQHVLNHANAYVYACTAAACQFGAKRRRAAVAEHIQSKHKGDWGAKVDKVFHGNLSEEELIQAFRHCFPNAPKHK